MNNDNQEATSSRRRVPKASSVKPRVKSAAVDIATNSLVEMSQEKEQFRDQARELEQKLSHSLKTIDELKQRPGTENAFTMSLPSGEVTFTMQYVDVKECEVWEGNSRQFQSLSLEKVKDIYPSIQASGVKDPVLGRQHSTNEALNQIVDGSRRLYSAGQAGIEKIPAWIGPMTDEDARFLTVIYNNGSRLSAYECGRFAIEEEKSDHSPFQSAEQIWVHLGISKTQFYRCKAIAAMPDYVLAVFHDVNEIPVMSGNELAVAVGQYLKKQSSEELEHKCFQLKGSVSNSIALNTSVDVGDQTKRIIEEALRDLTQWLIGQLQVEKKIVQAKPVKKPIGRAVAYKNDDGHCVLKSTTTKNGTFKVELMLTDKDAQELLLNYAKKLAGVP